MNSEETVNPQENTPRPFAEIPHLWLQLGQMDESFLSKELSHASVSNTFFSILVMTGIAIIFAAISSLISGVRGVTNPTPGLDSTQALRFAASTGIILCCFEMALVPLSFYLKNLVIFILALIFGGKGKYDAQAYLSSLYHVPLSLITGVVSFALYLPYIGGFIVGLTSLGVLIFTLVLDTRLLKVAHKLSTGKAVVALFVPLFMFILIPLCMILLLALMGPAVGNVFSSIINELGTPTP